MEEMKLGIYLLSKSHTKVKHNYLFKISSFGVYKDNNNSICHLVFTSNA